MLRNLSVLGIRSPVIITMESHDHDRRLEMGAALRYEWKGTDVAEANSIDCRCGSGRATFVAVMQPTDLGKCDDLAS